MKEGQVRIKVIHKPEVTDLAGDKVMIDFNQGKYLILKGVANDIWNLLQDEITPKQICDKLRQEYDVSEEDCMSSVMDFLNQLVKYQFICLEEE